MAEEFQGGICGGNWWSSSRSLFMAASPCSVGLNHDVAGFGWLHNDMVDIKGARSSSGDTNSICDSTSNNNNLNSGFHEVHKPHHHQNHDHNINGTGVLIDSSMQMMGFGVSNSPTSSDLNVQANDFLKRAENNNIYSVLQEDNMGTKLNYREEIGLLDSPLQIQKDFSGGTTTVTTTSEAALSAGFPVSSASYNNGYGSSAMLLQSLFDGGSGEANRQVVPQQQSFSNNNQSMTYNSSLTTANYVSNLGNNNNHNMVSSSWPRFPAPKKQLQQPGGLQFSNNTPFWNASDAAGGLFPSLPPQLQYVTPTSFEEKPKCITKANINNEEVQDSGSVLKKNSTTGIDHHHQPLLKRARIETPSPLPTFKVRKEKLGDRITALQQLVSPFGKTDTASVLHEAIEYIKFLHDQVLSSPYMKNGASIQVQQQCSTKLIKDQESLKQDLRSRGLCLVPISSTFPVANDHTTADFWTPTFGGTFR